MLEISDFLGWSLHGDLWRALDTTLDFICGRDLWLYFGLWHGTAINFGWIAEMYNLAEFNFSFKKLLCSYPYSSLRYLEKLYELPDQQLTPLFFQSCGWKPFYASCRSNSISEPVRQGKIKPQWKTPHFHPATECQHRWQKLNVMIRYFSQISLLIELPACNYPTSLKNCQNPN